MLRVSWSSGPGHPDEVEVRLSKADEGGTLLELEHASVALTSPDGVSDAILAVGVGWELAMAYLERHLREEGPPGPGAWAAQAAVQPNADDQALLVESARAWTALLQPGD